MIQLQEGITVHGCTVWYHPPYFNVRAERPGALVRVGLLQYVVIGAFSLN